MSGQQGAEHNLARAGPDEGGTGRLGVLRPRRGQRGHHAVRKAKDDSYASPASNCDGSPVISRTIQPKWSSMVARLKELTTP